MQQDRERQVRVLPAQRLDLGQDRAKRLFGRVVVDVVLGCASFPVALDTPAEEVEALVFSELILWLDCWGGCSGATGDLGEGGYTEFDVAGVTLDSGVELGGFVFGAGEADL
jgi:hypothetical protein